MLLKLERDPPEVGYLYLGGQVDWEYGYYTWTGPNYDAELCDDEWRDNGHRVIARTLKELKLEVDNFVEEL